MAHKTTQHIRSTVTVQKMSNFFTNLSVCIFLASLIFLNLANAARFDITNNCPYTVWAAAVPVGGGRQLNQGETWPLDVPAGTAAARIWARTGCQFDGSGRGQCTTGDCNGLLQCQAYGKSPNTLAEFALNQWMNLDFIDMSLIEGFNVPMEFSSTSGGCNQVFRCTADIIGQCPGPLRVPSGCNGPCPVFGTNEYCCNAGGVCNPTDYSRYFKDRCPDAYTYPKDDTATKSCPGGTNYKVVFCP